MSRFIWIFLGILAISTVIFLVFFYPFKAPLYKELGVARFVVEPILFISPFCAVWMIYTAIRCEPKPLLYVLLALFVPFAFVWYYVERARPRKSGAETVAHGRAAHPF